MPLPARLRHPRIVLAAALIGAYLALAAGSTRTAPETYPVADTATTSIATLAAARGTLSVGSYSRFGWRHPGPLLYQVLAGPYELSGRREMALKWTSLTVNLAWLAGLLALVGRRSPGLTLALAAALVPLLWREQRLLFSAWNPFVTVLALAFAIAAAADLATGRGWRSRLGPTWLVVASSFCVQAHVGLVVPSTVCILAAAIGLGRARLEGGGATWRAIRPGVLLAFLVAAALWATPLLAEVRERPGNLTSLVAFLADGSQPRATWDRAVSAAAYMTLGPFLPDWVVLYDDVPAHLPPWLLPSYWCLIVATAASAVVAHRRGRAYDAAFAGTAAATSMAVIMAAKGVVGPLIDYLLLWSTAVGALAAGAVLSSLFAFAPRPNVAERVGGFTRAGGLALTGAMVWAGVGGVRLTGKHAEQARDTTLRRLTTDLQAYCDRTGIARPLLALGGESAWQEGVGLLLQFAKQNRPIAIDDAALFLVGRSFARTGGEDATFLLMPTTGVDVPSDAPRRDWITTHGAYRIVRVR